MSTPENAVPKVRPEADSTAPHWCGSFFFLPFPDLSDDAVHTINAGRAMPAFVGILRALHDQGRRGRTEDIRADAHLGRLTIGLKALARANGMQDASLGRQLRYLERVGMLRVHDGERQPERDPATGRIVKGRGRTPPKVFVLTLGKPMMRPTREGRKTPQQPSQRPEETPRKAPLKGRDVRGGFRPPSKDAGSKEPASFGCRGTTDAGKPLEASGPAAPRREKGPADGRPDRPKRTAAQVEQHRARCTLIGEALGMDPYAVHLAGVADPAALRARVEAAGRVWETGKRKGPPPAREAVLDARRGVGEAVTATTTEGADAPEDIEERRSRILRELSEAAASKQEADRRREAEKQRSADRVAAIQWAIDHGKPIESIDHIDQLYRSFRAGELSAAQAVTVTPAS